MGSGNVCTVRLRKKLRNPEIQPAAAELSMEGGDTIKKVLWISRHEMTLEQKADLERLMGGEVELIRHWETVAELSALEPEIREADAVAAFSESCLLSFG